jgi:hypothetical protein
MDLFDTLKFAKILVGTTFLGTPTLTVLKVFFVAKKFLSFVKHDWELMLHINWYQILVNEMDKHVSSQ